nr:hypothetical protein [Tanacetum cinerariifolium]
MNFLITSGVSSLVLKNLTYWDLCCLELVLARFERERQEEASKAALAEMYDEVQAQIDVDHELAVRLTHEEQEMYTIEERFTHAQLKSMSFEEIQKLYIKEQKWVDAFVPIGSEEDKKRIGSRKKTAACDVHVYKLTRLDGSYRHFSTFSRMLEVLDREDVLDLHKIIMERFPANDPEGYYLILWGDLKTLVESSKDDKILRNQQDWKLLSWKLYETCGVHTLMLDDSSVSINMFVQKRYPLTKEILEKMLSSRLESETESTLALDLIKFIKLQIKEK